MMKVEKLITTVESWGECGMSLRERWYRDDVCCSLDHQEREDLLLILEERFDTGDIEEFMKQVAYLCYEYMQIAGSNGRLIDILKSHQFKVERVREDIQEIGTGEYRGQYIRRCQKVIAACKFPAREPEEEKRFLILQNMAREARNKLEEYEGALADYIGNNGKCGRPAADRYDLVFQVGVLWLKCFKELPPYSIEGIFHQTVNCTCEIAGHKEVSMRAVRDALARLKN